MRHRLLLLVACLGLALGALVAAPSATAQVDDDDAATTTTAAPGGVGEIIPGPNTGAEPEDAGDRGGSLQSALFVGIVVVIIGAGVLIARQSRRARADRGF